MTSGPKALITFSGVPIFSIVASSRSSWQFQHASQYRETVTTLRNEYARKEQFLEGSPANLRVGATMTDNRPSLGFPNRRSISVPPRSAIDTGVYIRTRVLHQRLCDQACSEDRISVGSSSSHLFPAIRNFEAVRDDRAPADSVAARLFIRPAVCFPTYLNKLHPYDMHHENMKDFL
uniref:Uncharacterized protein n=1 Tax=Aegilops tauschii subsp. strangulata TaxID=200361 RepID=A0A453CBB3_AEGTS